MLPIIPGILWDKVVMCRTTQRPQERVLFWRLSSRATPLVLAGPVA
jgi:hypothetical protein